MMNDVHVEKTYYEIVDSDYTGVDVRIMREGQVVARYSNFNRSEYGGDGVYANQTETF